MGKEGLNNTRYCDDTTDNGTESGIILKHPCAILLLGHADGCELILEIHARRCATEVGGLVEELLVLRHAVLVVFPHAAVERNGSHGNELQEVGDVIDLYSLPRFNTTTGILMLLITVQRVDNLTTFTEGQGVNDVRAVEGGEILLVVEVIVLHMRRSNHTNHAEVQTTVRQTHMEITFTLHYDGKKSVQDIKRRMHGHDNLDLFHLRGEVSLSYPPIFQCP